MEAVTARPLGQVRAQESPENQAQSPGLPITCTCAPPPPQQGHATPPLALEYPQPS